MRLLICLMIYHWREEKWWIDDSVLYDRMWVMVASLRYRKCRKLFTLRFTQRKREQEHCQYDKKWRKISKLLCLSLRMVFLVSKLFSEILVIAMKLLLVHFLVSDWNFNNINFCPSLNSATKFWMTAIIFPTGISANLFYQRSSEEWKCSIFVMNIFQYFSIL